MRLTILGHQILAIDIDVSIGPDGSDETEFETYQDAGTSTSAIITGEHNGWEKHPNSYDEPSEGDEGLRIGFQAKSPEQLKREFLRAQPPFPS